MKLPVNPLAMKYVFALLQLFILFSFSSAQIQRPEKEFNELQELQRKAKIGSESWHALTNQLVSLYISSDVEQAEKP